MNFNTDKDGQPVPDGVTNALERLSRGTNCHQVMCAWARTGRIQYWSKSSSVNARVFEVAEEVGYEIDHATTRHTDGRKRGYVEMVPQGDYER